MPVHLTEEALHALLTKHQENITTGNDLDPRIIVADVFIAGSGPIGCTYARTILDQRPQTSIFMAEIGSQDSKTIGAHHKNSIKYQKDIGAFVNVIKGALQPISIPPSDTFNPTLAGVSWSPPPGKPLVTLGNNPNQNREKNLPGAAITRTVGGMATHWTCSCPIPHEEETTEIAKIILRPELDILLERAKTLLNVNSDQFDNSIRHALVKKTLTDFLTPERGLANIPLAVKRRTDNPDYVTWTGCNTVLGRQIDRFKLSSEMRVTCLVRSDTHPNRITAAVVRDYTTDQDKVITAKAFIIACGSVGTPQILWNSNIRPQALGKYLTEQSMAFCQIVLKKEIIDSAETNPEWKERVKAHRENHPNDPLPIPFNDPEAQLMIPYTPDHPWHAQIHRDAFSYGDVGPKVDPRVVVDLRFFGKSESKRENQVTFPHHEYSEWRGGVTDLYGLPQATFEVNRSVADVARDQRMMKDMTNIANALGGFLPDSYPQFMEPGLALHITGTTRLGNDPTSSVANAESKLHEIENVWVGGNGCLPDATASNPTRTSVALAIRGAEAVIKYLA